MKKLKNPLVLDSSIIFQHKSPYALEILSPRSYEEIVLMRKESMTDEKIFAYIFDRIKEENKYRNLLNDNEEESFLYATIVGFNNMESPEEYGGFTYYFTLNKEQINNVIFEIIPNNRKEMSPQKGMSGLKKCLEFWTYYSNELKSTWDNDLDGNIDPRIEVIIPFSVIPFAYFPEKEQR